ncbi:MAG: hypothetical protein K2W99_02210 [Chthoniobacterales bacterium]|nr:hypothetical protein [Chthoniobacterales bacterium]
MNPIINKSNGTVVDELGLSSVNDRSEIKSSQKEGFYTDSNKPQGKLGRVYSFFFFFIRPRESANAFRAANQELASKIGEKYGAAFKEVFLKDIASKLYWGSPLTVGRLKVIEGAYQQTLKDLGCAQLNDLPKNQQSIFSKFLKINQQLEQLKHQPPEGGGIEKEARSLIEKKVIFLERPTQKDDTGNQLTQGTIEANTVFRRTRKINDGLNQFRAERNALHSQSLEKKDARKSNLSTVTTRKTEGIVSEGKGKNDKRLYEYDEYDVNAYHGVNQQGPMKGKKDWLGEGRKLAEEDNKETAEISRSSSSSFSSDTTRESIGPDK